MVPRVPVPPFPRLSRKRLLHTLQHNQSKEKVLGGDSCPVLYHHYVDYSICLPSTAKTVGSSIDVDVCYVEYWSCSHAS